MALISGEAGIGKTRLADELIRYARPTGRVVSALLGTLVAACHLGDDHKVAVFLDHCSPALADLLTAAGVPRHRLRYVG